MYDIFLLAHQYNPYLIIAASAIAGIWGLILYFRKSEAFKPWRIMMGITISLAMLQAVMGIVMALMGGVPSDGADDFYMHYLYGGLVALGIPLVWQLFGTNGKNPRKDLLYYSIAALLIAALAGRAWMTGPAQL